MTDDLELHLQVVAVTAVRTGAGKSQVSAYVNDVLHDHNLKTVVVRHPMPYGEHWPSALKLAYAQNSLSLTSQAPSLSPESSHQQWQD